MRHHFPSSEILKYLIGCFVLGFAALIPVRTEAISSAWFKTDETKVRIIAGTASLDNDREIWLGLHFVMQPGWKIYWRSPGDAGFPPEVKWTKSKNLAHTELLWPLPFRFSALGLETLGYENEVVLPVLAKVIAKNKTTYLTAQLRYLTCKDICIPYETKLNLKIPSGKIGSSKHSNLVNKFRAKVPSKGSGHGLKILSLNSLKNTEGAKLRLTVSTKTKFQKPDVFIEGPLGLVFSKPAVTANNSGKKVLMDVSVEGIESLDDYKGQTLENRKFVVTLVDGTRAVEKVLQAKQMIPSEPRKSSTGSTSSLTLVKILLISLMGGLILNLMPCVLPILSLKALSLIQHDSDDPRETRATFLASAAGIVTVFLILAGALSGMKASGITVTWGIQFQQPWFLVGIALLITIFACNLWGFFEFRLPQFISDFSIKAGRADGLLGHFLQGAFATLLATPCSAPFVGTAVGFALLGSSFEIFLVFSALGLGLALPYLAIAGFPNVVTWLPRPGAWIFKLKLVLGLALAASGIWVVSLLYGIAGEAAALVCASLMAASSVVLFFAHKSGGGGLQVSGPILLASLLINVTVSTRSKPPALSSNIVENTVWQSFDETLIQELVNQGQTIYVDVTADWCITCLVNKSLILSNKRIKDLLSEGNVIAMQADWTRPSETISDYLARNNRYGIPFNIVYGPKKPKGVVLPELLTPSMVLDAISSASGKKITSNVR